SIRTIPGVGPKTEERFRKMGIKIVKDAKRFSREELIEMMGKWGEELYQKLRAHDDAPLIEEWEEKSIGEQETFKTDTREMNFLQEHRAGLAADVHARFKKSGFRAFRGITITVRFADFTTKTRATTLKT